MQLKVSKLCWFRTFATFLGPWSVVGGLVGGRFLLGHWSVVGFPFGRWPGRWSVFAWSLVCSRFSIWSVVGGRWLVVGGLYGRCGR